MTTVPSFQDLTTALEVLLWLSEAREGEGRLRDSIALVRSELHEEVDLAAYQPCNHECNGCPTCDPGLTSARAGRSDSTGCTCVVGVCREDDEDGCCESPHCPAAPAATDEDAPSPRP